MKKIKNELRPASTPRLVFDFFLSEQIKGTVQYCTGLYSTVQYCTVLYESRIQFRRFVMNRHESRIRFSRFRFTPVPVTGSGSGSGVSWKSIFIHRCIDRKNFVKFRNFLSFGYLFYLIAFFFPSC